jgi:hypothetical protein
MGEGSESSGKGKRPKAPPRPPEIESLSIILKYIPHDSKPCECLKSMLTRVPFIKSIGMGATDVRMVFTGDWDQLIAVQNAAAAARTKAALVDPALFSIEYAGDRETQAIVASEALAKISGVKKVFTGGTRAYVFGATSAVDPRKFAPTLKDAGFKFVALRSHRLRTLSYEPWDKKVSPARIQDRLLKVPGVLRADVDAAASTVTVLLMRDTAKDLELVGAAEDVNVTLFPGRAEEDEEAPKVEGMTPTQDKK